VLLFCSVERPCRTAVYKNCDLMQECVLQYIAVCCIVSQCSAAMKCTLEKKKICFFNVSVRVCTYCSVLKCVAVCCSVLQCVAVCCSVLQCVAVQRSHVKELLAMLVCVRALDLCVCVLGGVGVCG